MLELSFLAPDLEDLDEPVEKLSRTWVRVCTGDTFRACMPYTHLARSLSSCCMGRRRSGVGAGAGMGPSCTRRCWTSSSRWSPCWCARPLSATARQKMVRSIRFTSAVQTGWFDDELPCQLQKSRSSRNDAHLASRRRYSQQGSALGLIKLGKFKRTFFC